LLEGCGFVSALPEPYKTGSAPWPVTDIISHRPVELDEKQVRCMPSPNVQDTGSRSSEFGRFVILYGLSAGNRLVPRGFHP